ncbi:MAG TPA: class I SAM-dependent methyltransferase [Thermoanaerobaculia bacterium]|nr:class I SAM-dependent methyltransferase [Thermoanaerobaculia bacterium]
MGHNEIDSLNDHRTEIDRGERFRFGANWSRFLRLLDEERIRGAEEALRSMLDVGDRRGIRFLDIGSGSGLMSLAARRLGMNVTSFDYDPQSVACTAEVKARFSAADSEWTILTGSVLDREFMAGLGSFDVVYSWGVLHHTGSMWEAIRNASERVAAGGSLFIAIYNDQGLPSRYWRMVKRLYNRNAIWRALMTIAHIPNVFLARLAVRLATGRPLERGMSLWYDMHDWLGGYPFEVATPEQVVDYLRPHGFLVSKLRTCRGRYGCNEFVFRRTTVPT